MPSLGRPCTASTTTRARSSRDRWRLMRSPPAFQLLTLAIVQRSVDGFWAHAEKSTMKSLIESSKC
jgi:hypothetical protein